jgi:two-component system, NtrC family, response regulator AtoC
MPHILLIEDDAQLRPVLARILRLDGYEVTEAAGGLSGLAAWREGGADVVMTDLHLGDMDGIDVLLQLRTQAPALPIVVMSGSAVAADSVRLQEAQLLANVKVLEKPFSLNVLTTVVRSALATSQQKQA